MTTFWNATARASIIERVGRLHPEAAPRWGKMTARGMLAHITDAGRMALGEIHAKPKRLPIRYFPIREMFVYVLPFPRNAPTAPELLTRVASDWDAEMGALAATLGRLVDRSTGTFPEHPAFGNMNAHAWGVLIYRHMDHHLRQFGV